MSEKENTSEIVKEMARLSVLSNRMGEVQEKNLKMFPLVFFESVKSARIQYDLSHKKSAEDEPVISNTFVRYHLDVDESKNDRLDLRFKYLEESVKNLFWRDITVEVYFGEKIVFKSKSNG